MSSSQRLHNGQVVVINDRIGDDFFLEPCPDPDCVENTDGFWTENAGRHHADYVCLACDNQWYSEGKR